MRIWLVPNSFTPVIGGVQIAVENLCYALIEKGYDVSILTSKYPKELKTFELVNGIPIYRFPFSINRGSLWSLLLYLFRIFPNMVKLIFLYLKERPDIINVHYVDEHTYFILALRRFFKFPIVLNLHGSDVKINPKRYESVERILKQALLKSDKVIANTNDLIREAENYCSVLATKSTIIPNGIVLNKFMEIDPKIEYDYPYMISIGRLVKEKGFDILIMAMSNIVKKHPKWRLLIIGDGIERDYLQSLSDSLNISENIKFLGEMDNKEVLNYIKSSKFLVLPSRREAFGIVLLEAMASGKAVVATRVGGVSEVVSNGVNGIIVKPENPDSLMDASLQLIENPNLANSMGAEGLRVVRKHFDWSKIVNKYISIYNSVASNY